MHFDSIIGHQHIKKHLLSSLKKGRIPHAQLFVAPQGTGALPMALAYAKQLLCFSDKNGAWTENPSASLKFDKLVHPDLHFAFPVTTTDKVKSKPISDLFIDEWRQFVLENPYRNVFEWLHFLGVEKKQGQIGVDEAHSILKKISLKAYEGQFKVLIVWMAEKMNTSAANKLLKLIEEPPKNTVLILITENEDLLLKTITSRCQTLRFLALPETIISKALQDSFAKSAQEAHQIAVQAQGNWNKACQLVSQDSKDNVFEDWFILWIRSAFKAKGNAAVINDLIAWSTAIASAGRETQKQFLDYCLSFFRQALLQNYKSDALVYLQPKTANFSLKKFAPFVNHANILGIVKAIETASYHIERNGNAKIILLDLSIQLTRLLHQKEVS
ncbi:MAG: DNA polymerase III subunit delta' [Flavobacteriaceae bacterium]|nr:DNA polymerase III subunit delta' [Flavobacteriaceae bacterium]